MGSVAGGSYWEGGLGDFNIGVKGALIRCRPLNDLLGGNMH